MKSKNEKYQNLVLIFFLLKNFYLRIINGLTFQDLQAHFSLKISKVQKERVILLSFPLQKNNALNKNNDLRSILRVQSNSVISAYNTHQVCRIEKAYTKKIKNVDNLIIKSFVQ